MTPAKEPSKFYAEYELSIFRREITSIQPAVHQKAALAKLQKWFERRSEDARGGILVLPTGGGKTFTAVHFACSFPLSHGYGPFQKICNICY